MIRIRAERPIAGDVILYGDSSWRVPSIGRSTRPTTLDPLMEFVHGDDHRTSSLRATVERDRVLQAILLVRAPRTPNHNHREREITMSYPRTIDDLAPDQRVSDPVVTIDYDLLDGLPSEAREAVLKAVSVLDRLSDSPSPHKGLISYNRPLVGEELDRALAEAQFDWKRLERMHDRFSSKPAEHDLFDKLTRYEINAWAIKEDKPLIETR